MNEGRSEISFIPAAQGFKQVPRSKAERQALGFPLSEPWEPDWGFVFEGSIARFCK